MHCNVFCWKIFYDNWMVRGKAGNEKGAGIFRSDCDEREDLRVWRVREWACCIHLAWAFFCVCFSILSCFIAKKLSDVECFDLKTMSWSALSPLLAPGEPYSCVQVYREETGAWEFGTQLSKVSGAVAAVVALLPARTSPRKWVRRRLSLFIGYCIFNHINWIQGELW